MAPPMIAPPISPPTTPAATPRCALAGVAASEPAIVATATKAANVFFMSWALLEMAPSASAGFKVIHASHSKPAVSLKKRTTVNPKLTLGANGLKKRFFQAWFENIPGNAGLRGDLASL